MPLLEFQCQHRFPSGFQLDVAFELDHRFTTLFGPSGAGKTTVLSIIAGFVRPRKGECGWKITRSWIRWPVCASPAQNRAVGVVFQDALLFPHLTVEANLRYGQRHRKAQKRAIDFRRVIEVLEIGGLLQRHPRNLSGGEKQRVALGRALLSGPELLLMDEPLASLDAPLRSEGPCLPGARCCRVGHSHIVRDPFSGRSPTCCGMGGGAGKRARCRVLGCPKMR